jgi:hypothetical protein
LVCGIVVVLSDVDLSVEAVVGAIVAVPTVCSLVVEIGASKVLEIGFNTVVVAAVVAGAVEVLAVAPVCGAAALGTTCGSSLFGG